MDTEKTQKLKRLPVDGADKTQDLNDVFEQHFKSGSDDSEASDHVPSSISETGKIRALDEAFDKVLSADKTQDLSDLADAEKTQMLSDISPSSTASFNPVSDKTQAIDIFEKTSDAKDGTRAFPAVIADDSQAKDMTVMLAEEYAAAMGIENKDSNADPDRDDSDAREVLEGAALVPTGETEVLPFSRKYFEQYEKNGEIPDEALEPQTNDSEDSKSNDSGPSVKYAGAHSIVPDQKKVRRRRIIIITICLVLAAVIGLAVFLTIRSNNQKAHEAHAVVLQVTAPEYGANDSKIPVHVEGIDVDKKAIDEVQFIDVNGRGIELISGNYVLSVPAAPLMESARIYRVPDARIEISVDPNLESGAEYAPQNAKINFEFAYLLDVSDEDIDNAYKYAVQSGFDEAKAVDYRDALRSKRDAELAAHRAEQEKNQRMTDTQSALTNYAKSKGETGINYKLIDIDGDGFPEMLLAGNSSSSVGAMCFAYAYDAQSHRVVELASAAGGSDHAPSIWYSTGTHEIALRTQGPSRETYTFYTVSGTTANVQHTYVHEIANTANTTTNQQSSSSAASSSASTSTSASSSSSPATAPVQDKFSLDGQPITLDVYNSMIDKLSNSFYAVSAPQ